MIRQENLAVGDWWAVCCIHDLQQITTSKELEEAKSMMPFSGGWSSLKEAIRYLLNPTIYSTCPLELQEDIEYALNKFGVAQDL